MYRNTFEKKSSWKGIEKKYIFRARPGQPGSYYEIEMGNLP